ncbi:DUF4838 domain-containing protein [Lignipirellula cremea]|uniref:Alpha glucuronidase N-terminal domain-containing protein n=1 Tax=Lignipirellula cremea TaxID=2528010 RepID=A0A518DM45_9BACT|nr:DUF4838 domain-containing protein [Lignipirellula cremea]QDU92917.1 hypothetical protein Pla8534_06900 [Lignipirellula cremea]
MHKLRSLLFLFALLAVPVTAQAAFVLVDKPAGVGPAPLILFADAPPYTVQAAEELAGYIEQICGEKPQLIHGAPDPLPARAVWLGVQPAVRQLFPQVDFDFAHPEEILLSANDQHLVIAGRDRWDPEHLIVEGIDEKIVGRQLEYGTANAIYTFVQDHLGVRWLWPGKLGEDVPQRATIAIEPFTYRHHPQIRGRGGVFNFSELSNRGYGRSHDWTRRQRLQLNSLQTAGGHAFAQWWDRLHETQPELFALQPNGQRDGHPSPHNAKLCQSNPAVWKQWLLDVEEQLKEDPNRTVFNGSPNDGWSSGHCVCEKCRAWDHPEGEPRLMHWHHFREVRPALSDRHVTFANQLARVLKERYPDKDYYVLMNSYGHSRPKPIKARPAKNVIISSVANFYGRTALVDRGSTWGTTHRDQFQAWGELTDQVIWRPNTGSPAGWQQGLPDLSIAQLQKDIPFVAEKHCIGIFIDGVWEHWATLGPQYYLMAQLVWDPAADGEKILADYYHRAFGPAAADVRAYFETFEQARSAFVAKPVDEIVVFNFPQMYTEELFRQADEHLQSAEQKVAGGPEIFQQRVAFVRTGMKYSELQMANIRAMRSYWQTKDEKVALQVQANWKALEAICAEHPYAINWRAVSPTTPRMMGLHPDHPNPRWKPEQVKDLDQN